MQTIKQVEVPASTKIVIDKIVCDLCRKESNGSWKSGSDNLHETTIVRQVIDTTNIVIT